MVLVSGSTLIRAVSLFHITLAFFFLTAPSMINSQNLVFMLGTAMKLPDARAFETKSPPIAFLAAVLGLLGITDLVAISMPEEISLYHWGSQAPIRLALFFGLCIYSFGFSRNSPLFVDRHYVPSTWGEGLKNRLVFTWAFVELAIWFTVFIQLREERRDLAMRIAKRRAEDETEKMLL